MSEQSTDDTVARSDWGRVTTDGTVYVRTPQGERVVGSWQTDAPDEGLAFFTRRFDDLQTQVALLEQRLKGGAAAPDAARETARRLRDSLPDAAAVGDLEGLAHRLDDLDPLIDESRQRRKAERAAAAEATKARKQAIVDEAEVVASGQDWKEGAPRLRALLEEWKSLGRLDRPTDDALWHRFSAARTTYTRRRKAHFAELAERRDAARVAKQALVAEAESLATSSDWAATSAAMRDLMTRWKAAGRAPREVDDALWASFRAAQDTFYSAREAANSERDHELGQNLAAKQALLAEAEALLPVTDPAAARARLRGVQDRWSKVGKVPREAVRDIEGRLRAVEEAVARAQDEVWRRSNPEARARAESAVAQLRESLASLHRQREQAEQRGDDRQVAQADDAIAARQAWLAQAEQTLSEFSGQ